jgi:hypothetical protein
MPKYVVILLCGNVRRARRNIFWPNFRGRLHRARQLRTKPHKR